MFALFFLQQRRIPGLPEGVNGFCKKSSVYSQLTPVTDRPVSRGFAVFADAWLSGWLAEISAERRRLTGNGSALEVMLHDYALYKSTFTLLYFTDRQTDGRTDRRKSDLSSAVYYVALTKKLQ